MARVFINGFGRIGRTLLRAWAAGKWPGLEISGINDIAAGDLCAHLFEYDSVFGPYQGQAAYVDGALVLDGRLLMCRWLSGLGLVVKKTRLVLIVD